MGIKEQIKAIIVKKPAVTMDADEVCFFQTKSQYGQQVEQITTTTKPGIGIGIGIPVTSHFGIGIGRRKVKTKTTREMVWEKTNCVILLTSKRFLYKISNKVYQLDLDTFQDIQLHKDAITIISNGTPYYFFMSNREVQQFMRTWGLIGEAARLGMNVKDFL